MSKQEPSPKTKHNKQRETDPMELVIANKVSPEKLFVPNAVKRSIVTMDEVSSILKEIPIQHDIEQHIAKDKKRTPTKISLSDEILEKGVVTRPLSTFTRAVLEATLSQLMAGNNTFTSAMLYRTMTGRASSESVSSEQQAQVEEAMTQLMFTPLHIDLKMYADNGQMEGDGQLKGPILPAEQLKMNIAGNHCTAYQVTNLPIIYRFCMATNSLTMTPISLLSIGKMSYTKRNLAILNDLQRRIAPIIYPVVGSYTYSAPLVIPYDNIYDVATEDDPTLVMTPVVKKRIRETVKKILDSWVDGQYLAEWENIMTDNDKVFFACKLYFPKNAPPELPYVPPITKKKTKIEA